MGSKLEERLQKLTRENRKIEKAGETKKVDRRKFNKGLPQSGRKPKEVNMVARGIKAYLDKHFNEEVEIQIVDPKTGKTKIIKKPRIVRVLEVLYDIGVKDRNPDALNKWLDRALGKPPQTIAGDEDAPIMIQIKPY